MSQAEIVLHLFILKGPRLMGKLKETSCKKLHLINVAFLQSVLLTFIYPRSRQPLSLKDPLLAFLLFNVLKICLKPRNIFG